MPFSKGVGEYCAHQSGRVYRNFSLASLHVAKPRSAWFSPCTRFSFSNRVTSGVFRLPHGRAPARRGLRNALMLIALVATTAAVAPVSAGWKDLGKHPGARAQRTAQGRAIIDLEISGRHLYAGYGDYAANTGPIPLYFYHLRRNAWRFDRFTMDTEAIYKFRDLPNGFWALGTDPRSPGRHHFSKRSRGWYPSNGLDRLRSDVKSEHVYDMIEWRGALWAAGGTAGGKGGLWRSRDNGVTWDIAQTFSLRPSGSGGFTRIYWLGVDQNELYVQPVDSCQFGVCPHPTSYIFNGETWRHGPDILQSRGVGAPTDQFDGAMLMRTNDNTRNPGYLHAIKDGVVSHPLGYNLIRDYAIGPDGYLYVLVADDNEADAIKNQVVIRTRNLVDWECLFQAVPKAISIEVDARPQQIGYVYLGLRNSRVKRRAFIDKEPCPARNPILLAGSRVITPGVTLNNLR